MTTRRSIPTIPARRLFHSSDVLRASTTGVPHFPRPFSSITNVALRFRRYVNPHLVPGSVFCVAAGWAPEHHRHF